jgi:hypothetical protein
MLIIMGQVVLNLLRADRRTCLISNFASGSVVGFIWAVSLSSFSELAFIWNRKKEHMLPNNMMPQ